MQIKVWKEKKETEKMYIFLISNRYFNKTVTQINKNYN